MEHAKKFVRKSTLIIIDPSDVQKPYAKKMQYLAKAWDGSKGRVGDNLGYWGCMAVACEPGKRRGVVPLQFRLWSTEAQCRCDFPKTPTSPACTRRTCGLLWCAASGSARCSSSRRCRATVER